LPHRGGNVSAADRLLLVFFFPRLRGNAEHQASAHATAVIRFFRFHDYNFDRYLSNIVRNWGLFRAQEWIRIEKLLTTSIQNARHGCQMMSDKI
jgi:hypothetical protein